MLSTKYTQYFNTIIGEYKDVQAEIAEMIAWNLVPVGSIGGLVGKLGGRVINAIAKSGGKVLNKLL